MCKLMDDLIKDVVKDEVRDDRLETAKKLIANGKLSYEEIAETYDLPLSTVEELASSMQKKDRAGNILLKRIPGSGYVFL